MSEFEPTAQAAQDLEAHATERLRAARELLKLELYADVVTRAYYAAFSAVTLLHYLAGDSYSSHRQVLGQFNKHYRLRRVRKILPRWRRRRALQCGVDLRRNPSILPQDLSEFLP